MKNADVMISLAGEQRKTVAEALKEALEQKGLSVWLDVYEVPIGGNLPRRIGEALEKSRVVVALISDEYIRKEWPMRELEMAVSTGLDEEERLIPVLVGMSMDEAARKAPFLKRIVAGNWKEGADAIATRIAAKLGKGGGAKKSGGDKPQERRTRKYKRLGDLTPRDARALARETLDEAKNLFRRKLSELEEMFPDVEAEVEDIGRGAFEATIWVGGKKEGGGGVFCDGAFGPNSIGFNPDGVGNRNSCQGWIDLERGETGGYEARWTSRHPMVDTEEVRKSEDPVAEGAELLWEIMVEGSYGKIREHFKGRQW